MTARPMSYAAAPESAETPVPAGGTYAVPRMDRSGVPTFCATLDEARELAAERVANHGGGCWVFRLVGTTTAVAAWLAEPGGDVSEPERQPTSDGWRVYP